METTEAIINSPLYKELWEKTDYVCPLPQDWLHIMERIVEEYVKLHPERNIDLSEDVRWWDYIGIPGPLILGGWIASDEHKKSRWVGAMVWAYENDLLWVIEDTPFEKYYGNIINHIVPETYWDIVEEVLVKKMCHKPGCTTCGCMELKEWMAYGVGKKRLRELLFNVTKEEIYLQFNFEWHDILEVIVHYFGKEFIEDADIYEEYQYVFEKYYEARRVHHKNPYDARSYVLREMREKYNYYLKTS